MLLHALPALLLCLFCFQNSYAQYSRAWRAPLAEDHAFHKGTLNMSFTWGATFANYAAKEETKRTIHRSRVSGVHDPLFIEYGVSPDMGIGISLGTDLFTIDPSKYYGVATSMSDATVYMSDASFFVSRHYVLRRFDASFSAAIGLSSVNINGRDDDASYQYNSMGYLVRASAKLTYFFSRNWGVTAMYSGFTNSNSSKNFEGNTLGKNFMTEIRGFSWEGGLTCKLR